MLAHGVPYLGIADMAIAERLSEGDHNVAVTESGWFGFYLEQPLP